MAIQEFVVPRSIPKTFDVVAIVLFLSVEIQNLIIRKAEGVPEGVVWLLVVCLKRFGILCLCGMKRRWLRTVSPDRLIGSK
jgi:hypothetical protein